MIVKVAMCREYAYGYLLNKNLIVKFCLMNYIKINSKNKFTHEIISLISPYYVYYDTTYFKLLIFCSFV